MRVRCDGISGRRWLNVTFVSTAEESRATATFPLPQPCRSARGRSVSASQLLSRSRRRRRATCTRLSSHSNEDPSPPLAVLDVLLHLHVLRSRKAAVVLLLPSLLLSLHIAVFPSRPSSTSSTLQRAQVTDVSSGELLHLLQADLVRSVPSRSHCPPVHASAPSLSALGLTLAVPVAVLVAYDQVVAITSTARWPGCRWIVDATVRSGHRRSERRGGRAAHTRGPCPAQCNDRPMPLPKAEEVNTRGQAHLPISSLLPSLHTPPAPSSSPLHCLSAEDERCIRQMLAADGVVLRLDWSIENAEYAALASDA